MICRAVLRTKKVHKGPLSHTHTSQVCSHFSFSFATSPLSYKVQSRNPHQTIHQSHYRLGLDNSHLSPTDFCFQEKKKKKKKEKRKEKITSPILCYIFVYFYFIF